MGAIYRFVTRTLFYNLIILLKKLFSFLFRFRKTFTGTILAILLAVVTIGMICVNFTPEQLDNHPMLILFLVSSIGLILYCVGNTLWLIMEHYGETDEPKIIQFIFGCIAKFFRDISRPLDEQERIDTENKEKRKAEKERKKAEKKKKAEEKRALKMAKYNSFERFDVMEIE
jgi:hypothetical protein